MIYEGVNAVKKGCCLIFNCKNGECREYNFWEKSLQNFSISTKEMKQDEDLVHFTREIVSKSIRDRLLSDVPIGAFLSGGLDSSIVTTIAQKSLGKLKTFNIAFLDDYDP